MKSDDIAKLENIIVKNLVRYIHISKEIGINYFYIVQSITELISKAWKESEE